MVSVMEKAKQYLITELNLKMDLIAVQSQLQQKRQVQLSLKGVLLRFKFVTCFSPSSLISLALMCK